MRRLYAIGVLLLAACQGAITEPGEDHGGSGGTTGTTSNGIAPGPRAVRLTHAQWENTVRDLFELSAPTGLSSTFPSDAVVGGFIFDNNSNSLLVEQTLFDAYARAAADVIEIVMNDSAVLGKILPPAGGDDATRARQFIEDFGRRVYRRPLTAAEVDQEYVPLFNAAPQFYSNTSPFDAGVRHVLAAFLQSPHFLYRVERSTAAKDGAIPLDNWEIASRLSYSLWNTMPDPVLFDAAVAGELVSVAGAEAQARRMLDDPRAEDVVVRFHSAVLNVAKYADKVPDTNAFPEIPANLPDFTKQETELFVRSVFSQGAGFGEILTSNKTFVNAELAALYGLSGSFGSQFSEVTLDPAKRRGIFTQIGFLAANATSAEPDPIHRGAYLVRRIACINVKAPPDDVPPLPLADGKTNRETVEQHTQKPGTDCQGCHETYINPYGFAFENYDAFGRWRDTDNGHPVNAASAPLLDGVNVPVQNGVDLADKLAASTAVHECYTKYWVEFAFGRKKAAEDQTMIEALGADSRAGASVKDVIAKLVTHRAFLNRSQKELP
jgi:hypothetical protein